jgi:amino acid transporter
MEAQQHPETGREESEQERADRNLQELVGELRVALPGVQVLFAFLLVVPFNQRWTSVTSFQEKLYLVTLLFSALATAFLIAPSIHHRIEFRKQDKEHLVVVANRLAVIGLGFLALAMIGSVVLVTDVVFASTTTTVVGILVGLLFAVLWYAVPLRRRLELGS